MVVVVGPGSQEISGADAAVARLAAVEVPGTGGEVDRVARIVHGDVDVVVAFVLVGGGALGAGEGVLVGWIGGEEDGVKKDIPVTAGELVGFAVGGARGERSGRNGCAQGDDGCEEGGGVHVGG